MRAFIAIVRDCFHEALVSKVLWILFLLITMLLLAVAPFGFEEGSTPRMRTADVRDPKGFVKAISAAETPQARRVRDLWDPKSLAELSATEELAPEDVAVPLNAVLANKDFYEPESWKGVTLRTETSNLLAAKADDDNHLKRNRLLLEDAFPGQFEKMDTRGVQVSYFGEELGDPLPQGKREFVELILAGFMTFFVGAIGVFTAILVTSTMIPRTFEAGEIDLLLSKPVSRITVYLSRYAGGCAFILLLAGYFLTSLWLISGFRYGYWNPRLLLCIPVFMFLFAIYYSVSALAGAVWRNPIISIVVTILFWAMCFGVGTTKETMDALLIQPSRLVSIAPSEDELLAINTSGDVLRWSSTRNDWDKLRTTGGNMPDMPIPIPLPNTWIGPVHDPANNQFVFIRRDMDQSFSLIPRKGTIYWTGTENDWIVQADAASPVSPYGLYVDKGGRLLCLARSSFEQISTSVVPSSEGRESVRMFECKAIEGRPSLSSRFAMAYDARNDRVATYDRSGLSVWARNAAGGFEKAATIEEEFNEEGLLAIGGETVLLAREMGVIQLRSVNDLKVLSEVKPEGDNGPRFAACSPDGRWFAVVFHHGELWFWDAKENKRVNGGPASQGDVAGIAFAANGDFLVCNKKDSVVVYDGGTLKKKGGHDPEKSWVDRVYYMGVKPLHYVFPKPRELTDLTMYFLSGKKSMASGPATSLADARVKLRIWQPIVSNLVFTLVMLLLGSWYVSRRDF